MGRAFAAVVVVVVAGCAYQPGSYHARGVGSLPPHRAKLGCLELGVGLHDVTTPRATTLRYGLGNACDHRIQIDLSAVRVEVRDVAGNRFTLAAAPATWLRPRELGARWHVRELVRYQPPAGPVAEVREVCVDVAPVHATSAREHWICFAAGGAS